MPCWGCTLGRGTLGLLPCPQPGPLTLLEPSLYLRLMLGALPAKPKVDSVFVPVGPLALQRSWDASRRLSGNGQKDTFSGHAGVKGRGKGLCEHPGSRSQSTETVGTLKGHLVQGVSLCPLCEQRLHSKSQFSFSVVSCRLPNDSTRVSVNGHPNFPSTL